jgi:hypothetical protein
MDWREAAAGGLPAPRNDEPASLRQDILDEVADHLDCALKRELTKNITPEEAVENVKRRFGDPRDLARRLWLDAMKDTIMSKRLTRAAMGLMFVMCLLLGWMAWTSQRASQEAAWTSREAANSIRRTNNELLQKLTAFIAARPAAGGATERVPVRFHLICDDVNKSPARGFEGTLTVAKSGSLVNALRRVSDAKGELDFGTLPPGSYSISVTSPWHETTRFEFDASPGFPISSPIVCPEHDWSPADVSFELKGLPSLRHRDAWIICLLASGVRRQVGDLSWGPIPADGAPQTSMGSYYVVLDQSGRIIYFGDASAGAQMQHPDQYKLVPDAGRNNNYFQRLIPTSEFSWLIDALKRPSELKLRDRKYVLQSIAVVLASDIRRHLADGGKRSRPSETLLTWEAGWTPVSEGREGEAFTGPQSFHAIAGRKNIFEIRLLPRFAEFVDRMLISSASRVPESTNAAEAKTDAAAGAELLKTLGIEGATPIRMPEGLTGLGLKSFHDGSLARQVGLKSGDLLLGVEGWNVNNDRELGWASRADRSVLPLYQLSPHGPFGFSARSPMPRSSLLVLVLRGTQTLLYEIPPAGAPTPAAPPPTKDQPPAKSSAPGGFSGTGLPNRRRAPAP